MSDVIKVMEEALEVTGDLVTALKVGEERGWRLVPVEPTQHMSSVYELNSIAPIGPISIFGYKAMVKAAPRPWEEK